MLLPASARAVVLVEGESDAAAVSALAARRGRALDDVPVVAMGGGTGALPYLREVAARGLPAGVLCDESEERHVRRAAGLAGVNPCVAVCRADLEDELIRSLGVAAVEEVLSVAGELGRFRTLQHQPAQAGRPVEAQLRRWFGSGSGRKARYAPLLVAALDLDRAPAPLDAVLAV